jgi:hypothetical protein
MNIFSFTIKIYLVVTFILSTTKIQNVFREKRNDNIFTAYILLHQK